MTPKDAIKEKLKELPQDFQGLLETAIMPTLAEVPAPANEAEAVIAQGHLAKYLLVAFDRLGGLPILEVPLRIGQFVPAQHVLAVSALEFVGAQAGGEIQMITPTPGGSYYGAVTEVRCKVANVSSVTVSADGDTFELSQESGGEWAGLWAFPIGSHSITVTAGAKSLDVNFEVAFWPISPADGATVSLPIEIKVDTQGTDISGSVRITSDTGETTEAALQIADGFLSYLIDQAGFAGFSVLTIAFTIAYNVQEYYNTITYQNLSA